jgi:hypothetical protein
MKSHRRGRSLAFLLACAAAPCFSVAAAGATTLDAGAGSITGVADYDLACTGLSPVATVHMTGQGVAPSVTRVEGTADLSDQRWSLSVPPDVLSRLPGVVVGSVVEMDLTTSLEATNTTTGAVATAPRHVALSAVTADAAGHLRPAGTSFSAPSVSWTATGGSVAIGLASMKADLSLPSGTLSLECAPDRHQAIVTTAVVLLASPSSGGAVTVAASRVQGVLLTRPVTALARTGFAMQLLLALAVAFLEVGYLAWSAARPAPAAVAT